MTAWEPPGPPPTPPYTGAPPYGAPTYGAPQPPYPQLQPPWGPQGSGAPPTLPWYRSTPFLVLGGLGALVVGGVFGAVLAVIGVTASETFDEGLASGTTATYGPGGDLSSFTLGPGQCALQELFDARDYGEGAARSCEAEHGVEHYATASAPTIHGDEAGTARLDLEAFADEACYAAFAPYVGLDYAESDYDYAAVIPSARAWDDGARTIHCLVFAFDGGTTRGTARRSNR